jgi:hypothetical protein
MKIGHQNEVFNGFCAQEDSILRLLVTANDFYGRCMTSRFSPSHLKMQKTYAALITKLYLYISQVAPHLGGDVRFQTDTEKLLECDGNE